MRYALAGVAAVGLVFTFRWLVLWLHRDCRICHPPPDRRPPRPLP